jgi:hypothetical protein
MVQVTGEREGWTLIPGLTELLMNQAWPVAHLYPSMQKADGPYRLLGPSQVGPALEGQLWSQGPSGGFTGDRATAAPPKPEAPTSPVHVVLPSNVCMFRNSNPES